MKLINRIIFIAVVFAALIAHSCTEPEDLVTANAREGGLLDAEKKSINYVVGGAGPYSITLLVHQGNVKTTKINFYKSFYDTKNEKWSNEVLERSLNITNDLTHYIKTDFIFQDLIANLSIGGNNLPSSDTQYNIGDYWQFRLESETNNGLVVQQGYKISMAVSTRFAGVYEVIESEYWHPSLGFLGDWNGETREIVSVDATTYHFLGMGAFTPADDDDNEFYFVIDANDNLIIPKNYNGELQTAWGGDEIANCVDNPGELTNAHCDLSGYVVRADDGRDLIYLAYGYIRASGTRQFYEVLRKKN